MRRRAPPSASTASRRRRRSSTLDSRERGDVADRARCATASRAPARYGDRARSRPVAKNCRPVGAEGGDEVGPATDQAIAVDADEHPGEGERGERVEVAVDGAGGVAVVGRVGADRDADQAAPSRARRRRGVAPSPAGRCLVAATTHADRARSTTRRGRRRAARCRRSPASRRPLAAGDRVARPRSRRAVVRPRGEPDEVAGRGQAADRAPQRRRVRPAGRAVTRAARRRPIGGALATNRPRQREEAVDAALGDEVSSAACSSRGGSAPSSGRAGHVVGAR